MTIGAFIKDSSMSSTESDMLAIRAITYMSACRSEPD
ncbi:hypothetical protein X777_12581 [Ooceraea biroi]|uniref:Uncharacterized protein n=1 Tax=Ooceraea biroi TaxID=2015173 RepID=A0A026VZJ8_OOCBI|nr:hypothetical protein X777_12581 [Ooceraea biroi]